MSDKLESEEMQQITIDAIKQHMLAQAKLGVNFVQSSFTLVGKTRTELIKQGFEVVESTGSNLTKIRW